MSQQYGAHQMTPLYKNPRFSKEIAVSFVEISQDQKTKSAII